MRNVETAMANACLAQISQVGAQTQLPSTGSPDVPHFISKAVEAAQSTQSGTQMRGENWDSVGASAFPIEPTALPHLPTYEQATAVAAY